MAKVCSDLQLVAAGGWFADFANSVESDAATTEEDENTETEFAEEDEEAA